jgi:hypothetical protein
LAEGSENGLKNLENAANEVEYFENLKLAQYLLNMIANGSHFV